MRRLWRKARSGIRLPSSPGNIRQLLTYLILDPPQVIGIAVGDRDGNDFGNIIGMQSADTLHQEREATSAGLKVTKPLPRMVYLAFPPVRTGDRSYDLSACGEALLDEPRRKLLSGRFVWQGGSYLAAVLHTEARPAAPVIFHCLLVGAPTTASSRHPGSLGTAFAVVDRGDHRPPATLEPNGEAESERV